MPFMRILTARPVLCSSHVQIRPPIFVENKIARKTQNFDYFARKNRKIIYYIDAAKKEKNISKLKLSISFS